MIEEIEFRCMEATCPGKFKLTSLEAHGRECNGLYVTCPLGCKTKL